MDSVQAEDIKLAVHLYMTQFYLLSRFGEDGIYGVQIMPSQEGAVGGHFL